MAGETSGVNIDAHFITIDDVISPEQLLRTKERFVASFLLHNGLNNKETSALFDIYLASSGETRATCAVLEEHLGAIFSGGVFMAAAHDSFVNSTTRAHKHQVQTEAALRSLDISSGEKLRRINALKIVSLVLFTAAAAVLVFGALGGLFRSCLKKRESAEGKQREIIGLMILGSKTAIDGLASILLCSSHMESTSKEPIFEVRKKMTALKRKFQEMQSDYRGDTRYSREFVLDRMIKHINYVS